ncbi:MAG: hypothetical protein HY901_23010 [Deltaproteobacteria bacterium]|nr:hypothetical protein [Deltaproteobacteria bacterium]
MTASPASPITIRYSMAPKVREKLESPSAPGRIPRVTRLLALAHKFQRMIDDGTVESMADLARLGHVTRARVTQIMDLLLLAPDIQEALLFLPSGERGHDPIHLRELRYVCQAPVWAEQRARWAELGVATQGVRVPDEKRREE